MRFVVLTILLVCLPLLSFGQDEANPQCPKIQISGPTTEITKPGVSVRFDALVTGFKWPDLHYRWTASDGIIERNGDLSVEVSGWKDGVTVTLEIDGLPEGCENSASATAPIFCGGREPIFIDEMAGPFSKVAQERYDNFLQALKNDPTAMLHVILYVRPRSSRETENASSAQRAILRRFARRHRETIRFMEIEGTVRDHAKFYIVPVGASDPVP